MEASVNKNNECHERNKNAKFLFQDLGWVLYELSQIESGLKIRHFA